MIEKYDLFVGSQVTDYGEALTKHDEFWWNYFKFISASLMLPVYTVPKRSGGRVAPFSSRIEWYTCMFLHVCVCVLCCSIAGVCVTHFVGHLFLRFSAHSIINLFDHRVTEPNLHTWLPYMHRFASTWDLFMVLVVMLSELHCEHLLRVTVKVINI